MRTPHPVPLMTGDPAPRFVAPTPTQPLFSFHTVAGRFVLLAFVPTRPAAARAKALADIARHRAVFDDEKLCVFGVLRHPVAIRQAVDQPPGVRWFLDGDGAISRLYEMLDDKGREKPSWLLLDPTLRVMANIAMDDPNAELMLGLLASLPPVDAHAATRLNAPVLIVPRVFEPEFCQHLIATYDAQGGQASGFMRDVGGRTMLMQDPSHKRRSDVLLEDEALREAARARLLRRLSPEIVKAFQFQPTRVERYVVSRYDSAELGFFRPHRDNTTLGTAHRKFAVTLNLNTEDYDGGELRFPEFGSATYRAPTGGAVVFSCSLLHEATPVTRGVRYAFLPFLYDEAGAALRDANAAFLADDVPGSTAAQRGHGAVQDQG